MKVFSFANPVDREKERLELPVEQLTLGDHTHASYVIYPHLQTLLYIGCSLWIEL